MAVSDGAGGAIIAWEDSRSPSRAIFAQRIDYDGNIFWSAGGESIFTEISGLAEMFMISDGAGGAIVVWSDARSGDWDIFAQRFDGN